MPHVIINKVSSLKISSNILQLPGSKEFMRQIDIECEDGSTINLGLFAPYAEFLMMENEEGQRTFTGIQDAIPNLNKE